jgi:hypothetical protein
MPTWSRIEVFGEWGDLGLLRVRSNPTVNGDGVFHLDQERSPKAGVSWRFSVVTAWRCGLFEGATERRSP